MKINTEFCTNSGQSTVAVRHQEIEGNNKGTLLTISRRGIGGPGLDYYQAGKAGRFTGNKTQATTVQRVF